MSFLEIRAERRQKSIPVEFSFATFFAFKHHISDKNIYIYMHACVQLYNIMYLLVLNDAEVVLDSFETCSESFWRLESLR